MNSRMDAIWLFSEMNSKAEALTAQRPGTLRCADARVYHRAFVNQSEQRRPTPACPGSQSHPARRERATAPRPASAAPSRCASSSSPGLSLAVVTPQAAQHPDQSLRRVHADVLMEDRPPDLEHADEVVTDEKVVGQRRSGFDDGGTAACIGRKPVRRPVLQAKVADRDGRVRGLLRREGPCLDGTSGHNRVRKIGELLAPHRIGGVIAVARELHLRLDAREARRVALRSVEQRSRRLREDTRLEEHLDDGGDRICGVLRSGRCA